MTGAWTAAFVVLSLATLVSIILNLGLVRRVSTVLEEMGARNEGGGTVEAGVPRGFQLGPFEVERADGSPMAFAWPGSSPSIFLFMEPGCAPCERIAPALSHVGRGLHTLPLYVVTPHESGDGWLPVSGDFVRLLDRDEAAASAFRNVVSPQAFAVDRHGVVRERKVVASADDLSSMASSVWEEVGEPIRN